MKPFLSVCALCLALSASSASAGILTHTFDISGLGSDGGFGASFPTLTYNFGKAGTVTSVSFDVNATINAPSWSSELQIAIDTNDDLSLDADVNMADFGGMNNSDPFAAAGAIGGNTVSSDGVVYLTLYELFNDGVVLDAVYGAGSTVTVNYAPVPEPASGVLLGVGLALAAVARRRLT